MSIMARRYGISAVDDRPFPSHCNTVLGVVFIGGGILQDLISCQDRLAVGTFSPDGDDLRYQPINYKCCLSNLAIGQYKDALPIVRDMIPKYCAIMGTSSLYRRRASRQPYDVLHLSYA